MLTSTLLFFYVQLPMYSTSSCLDAYNINEDEDEIRICVISYDEDLLEISFLQITQTDPLGDEVTLPLDI